MISILKLQWTIVLITSKRTASVIFASIRTRCVSLTKKKFPKTRAKSAYVPLHRISFQKCINNITGS